MNRYLMAAAAVCLAFPLGASASFHFMQIEQVIGGVEGDSSLQAVQLRQRFGGQNLVSGTRVIAYDAEGLNPIVLLVFPSHVDNGTAGARILLASPGFEFAPGIAPDFVMANAIPPGYLAAGRLTFSSSTTDFWSLCWGGAAYTGPTTAAMTNDDDGDFGPCFAGPLPSADRRSVLFTGEASAQSTTNAADYALSESPAIFTNNFGQSGSVAEPPIFVDGFESLP